MAKFQAPGVEGLAGPQAIVLAAAIFSITDYRIAQKPQMYPDLMGAPRMQIALHCRFIRQPVQDRIGGSGRLAAGYSRHFLAVLRVSADGRLNDACRLTDSAPYQGKVLPLHGSGLDLLRQTSVGGIVFGCHQEAGGIFIQSMHNTGP
ncbi:hypothetical protein SDC9_188181 [bioreactor metagenome]|uniref:Uncharacterized protein n=1 Tax=bioreactor metagenome TaxID=1076179 RepID=A0A645HZD3_9ZZZZ